MEQRLFQYSIRTIHARQQIMGFYNSQKQYNIVPSGRRSYKTETAKRRLRKRMVSCHDPTSPYYVARSAPNYFIACPTLAQTIRIYWKDMVDLLKPFTKKENKSQRTIEIWNGATLYLLSGEAPERFEGPMWDGGILDEFGNMAHDVWTNHIAACVADTGGYVDFIGVPEGHNHYYKLFTDAKDMPEYWDTWHWKSIEVLPDRIIEQYRMMLDETTFRQEFEGSFENYQGRAYYPFDRTESCRKLEYNPDKLIVVCLDFNVEPGVAGFAQEQGQPDFKGTGIIGEVHIGKNSNTEMVCAKAIQMIRSHKGPIDLDGDATGGARRTCSDRTDWEIALNMFRNAFPGRVSLKTPRQNPFERDRINAVNARLKNGKGERLLMFDPDKCPRTIDDFDCVSLNDKGELDKKTNPNLTHHSDAIGYHIARCFPVIQWVDNPMKMWK